MDRERELRVQRLQLQRSHAHARPPHLFSEAVRDVHELGCAPGLQTNALADHHRAPRARSKSWRVLGAPASEAAAADISSIARANATCTLCGAASASSLEERARQRSPIRSVGGAAARSPSPW